MFGILADAVVTELVAAEPLEEGVESGFQQKVVPFLTAYCLDCHQGAEPSGDRDFSMLSGAIAGDNDLVDLQDVLDQLNLSEMPPSDAKQPGESERAAVIDWLNNRIRSYSASRIATRQVVLRRLNSREYRNVVRDLFGFNMTMFDPTTKFPLDQQSEHLDNLGDTLVTSGFLLARYLEAGSQVVDKAMYPLEKPSVQTWRFSEHFDQQPEIDQVHRRSNGYEHLTLYDVIGADKHEGAYAPIHEFSHGVTFDGFYEISFDATALHRDHPYDDAFLKRDRQEPFRLGIVAGNENAGTLHLPQPNEPLLADVELADGQERYTVRVWLDAGYTPRFTFRNGLMDARNLWARIQKRYPEMFPKVGSGIVAARRNAIVNGKLPQIHVDNIEITGPIYEEWPRPSHRALLGEDWEEAVRLSGAGKALSTQQVKQHVTRLLRSCYRRPVGADEVERIVQLVEQRRHQGKSFLVAYGEAITAALCSPNFLYWEDSAESPEQETRLSDSALAQRLSAFLWSSMPDNRLAQKLATVDRDEQLNRVLHSQVERMLRSEKSAAFVADFLDSWLTLRDLGSQPPDRTRFNAYYQYELGPAMLEETRLFTRHLLDENLSIEHFVDSDFTFLNKRLAEVYGEPVTDSLARNPFQFKRVQLSNPARGGLLGQASVLTVSANGIDTSPVVRGVWVLENLLGTPPSPPPPDVEPLDPDVRGAKTIRQQLDKHRSVESCNGCHRKIDPIGFALENFDPIGRWRNYYENSKRLRVDAAGELPNGEQFEDIVELKKILLKRPDVFSRSLTTKLMTYGLGRHLGPADRAEIDRIVEKHGQAGYGFRDLIHLVVQSDLFLSP